MSTVGQRIREHRKRRGLTLQELAARSGAGPSQLSQLERGATDPRLTTLDRIAVALGTTPAVLLGKEPIPMTSTALVSIEAAAADLGTTPLAIRRLIARGQLAATRLGAGPKASWRIDAEEVRRYVNDGAADFDAPPMRGGWLDADEKLGVLAGRFLQDIIFAAAGQVPPDDQPPKSNPVELAITPAIQRVIAQAPSPELVALGYTDMRLVYLAVHLRSLTEKVIPVGQGGPKNAKLYESPDRYEEIVAKGAAALVQGFVAFSRQFVVNRTGIPEREGFQFRLSHKQLAPPAILDRVTTLAF